MDIDVAAVNVRTLSPRVGILLGWGFQVIAALEVRTARPATKSLARVARSHPSPTFSVSPGGLAVFSLLPRSLRKLHPPEWEEMGRVPTVDAIEGDVLIVIVAVYGLALSHLDHGMNDDMLVDCFAWSGRQKIPVICLGDLNENLNTSPAIVSAQEHGVWRVSLDSASTTGKRAHTHTSQRVCHWIMHQ